MLVGIAVMVACVGAAAFGSGLAGGTSVGAPTSRAASASLPPLLKDYLSLVEDQRGASASSATVVSVSTDGGSAEIADTRGSYFLSVRSIPEEARSLAINEATDTADVAWIADATTGGIVSGPVVSGRPTVLTLQTTQAGPA